MDSKTKTTVGIVLTAVSSVVVLYSSTGLEPILPGVLGSIAMLTLALGVLLIGTAESEGRPV